jgi:tetratricopeptide (TPR) repeat protein
LSARGLSTASFLLIEGESAVSQLQPPTPVRSACRFLCAALLLAAGTGCHMASTGYNVEGVRMYEQGNHQAAIGRFQQAITNDSQNADAYYNLARTFHTTGQQRGDAQSLKHAEMLYNQCLDVEADHVDCHRGLAVLLAEMGEPEKGFNLLKNWANRRPEMSEPRIELARLYEEFGDADTATKHLQSALLVDSDNPRAWAALGRLRELDGDYAQAMVNYQHALNRNAVQGGVAQRIAALQSTTNSSPYSFTPPGGTRMVNQPSATIR